MNENENEKDSVSIDVWNKEYDALIKNAPKAGDILISMDASPVLLVIETVEGSAPFVYGCAFVPEVVGSELGWFLQSVDSEGFHGFKCILMPRARTELIRRLGLSNDIIEVKSLRVVKTSQSGKSLLCEVFEY
ncbi:hypothetical protein LCGC14_1266100 [marine sediment metagenome]|uniref:Uncharacterized protein n=1 Tax=marine sediment metagenome TaxID=412755 RepID=A0A0F9NG29_9ZZZZ